MGTWAGLPGADRRCVYSQGLNRSHPHLLDLIETIRAGNDLAGFNRCARSLAPARIFCASCHHLRATDWIVAQILFPSRVSRSLF